MSYSKNVRGALVVLGVVVIVAGVYYFYSHNKRYYAKEIVNFGGSDSFVGLMGFEEGYLKEWAKALVKAKQSFSYNGKTYNTQGGTAIVS